MNKYFEALNLLAELAGEYGDNTYKIVYYAFGFIPFKNGENKSKEVGIDYNSIARWLIDEGESNFNNSLNK